MGRNGVEEMKIKTVQFSDIDINNIFNTPQKRRCRDCAYLVEADNGDWVCDDCGKEIHSIPNDECSAEMTF